MHSMSNGGGNGGLRYLGFWCVLMAAVLGARVAPAQALCVEQQKLIASDAADSDRYGTSVSISGDVILVGADGNDCVAGAICGSAYVLRFDGTTWVEEQILTASDAGAVDQFGFSVAVSGDTAIVGAARNDCAVGSECGAAYVFRFNGTLWVQEQKLTASDAAAGDFFGAFVSLDGDTAVVGAISDDCAAGSNCGAAYVYRFDGMSWVEEQKLTASDAAPGDFFAACSVNAGTIVVGANGVNCAVGDFCGSVYVFRFNGTSWVEEQKLTASDQADDRFGLSVSLSAGTIVVGAFADDCTLGGADCGSVYVFRFNGASWVEAQKLTAADAAPEDMFGVAVSVSGTTAVIGASQDDCATGSFCGSAYVFQFNGSSWVQRQKLIASDAAGFDGFGFSVSVSGDTTVAGAVGNNCGTALDCGAAYVFRCGDLGIPAVSSWGVLIMVLIGICFGTVAFDRRRRHAASSRSPSSLLEKMEPQIPFHLRR